MFHRIFGGKEKIIVSLFLSLLGISIFLAPLLINAGGAAFFTIDPDIVYLSNITSFVKTGKIYYFDHPGTPAIMLQSILALPMVVYVKLFTNYGFLAWSLINFDALAIYFRMLAGVVVAIGLFLVFYAVYWYTKKLVPTLFAFILLLTFEPIYYAAISISAEATNILLSGAWVFVLAKFIKIKKTYYIYLLAALAGLAVANRLTALALPLATLLLAVVNGESFKERISISFKAALIIAASFLLGLMPVIEKLKNLLTWVITLSTKTGLHGEGSTGFVSLDLYKQALEGAWNQTPLASSRYLVVLLLGLIVYLLITKNKQARILTAVGVSALFISFAFLKYPLIHYQTTNFILIVFLVSAALAKTNTLFNFLILVPFLFSMQTVAKNYKTTIEEMKSETAAIEIYNNENPPEIAEVWDWARAKKFSLIWARDYTGVYSEDLLKIYPQLYSVQKNYTEAKGTQGIFSLFDLCWDQLYIQKSSLQAFLNENKDKNLAITEIPKAKSMVLISRPSLDFEKCDPSHTKQ